MFEIDCSKNSRNTISWTAPDEGDFLRLIAKNCAGGVVTVELENPREYGEMVYNSPYRPGDFFMFWSTSPYSIGSSQSSSFTAERASDSKFRRWRGLYSFPIIPTKDRQEFWVGTSDEAMGIRLLQQGLQFTTEPLLAKGRNWKVIDRP